MKKLACLISVVFLPLAAEADGYNEAAAIAYCAQEGYIKIPQDECISDEERYFIIMKEDLSRLPGEVAEYVLAECQKLARHSYRRRSACVSAHVTYHRLHGQ